MNSCFVVCERCHISHILVIERIELIVVLEYFGAVLLVSTSDTLKILLKKI